MATELLVKTLNNKRRQYVGDDDPLPVRIGASESSQFGEVLAASRTPLIELNSAYGLSAIRDVQTTSNSATITKSSTGEILLSTGATASSTARLDTAERIRYVPGYSLEAGIGIRIPTEATGNQEAKWGIRQPAGNEGIYFGHDADGMYVAHIRNGTETVIRQADWNVDKLDGTGNSGGVFDISDGHIFQILFSWYGYGQITWGIVEIVGNYQRFVPVHQTKIVGTTSVQSPNLPLFVEATNGGDAADFDVYVGGRQASVVGTYRPKFRIVGQEGAIVNTSTTSVPLLSFRNKTNFEDRSITLESFTAVAATENHIVEFYVDASLTGASWTTPTNATAAETAVETDVSATALTGGTLVYTAFVASGQANKEALSSSAVRFDIPENQPITMAARTVTGTGTCRGFFRLEEEW